MVVYAAAATCARIGRTGAQNKQALPRLPYRTRLFKSSRKTLAGVRTTGGWGLFWHAPRCAPVVLNWRKNQNGNAATVPACSVVANFPMRLAVVVFRRQVYGHQASTAEAHPSPRENTVRLPGAICLRTHISGYTGTVRARAELARPQVLIYIIATWLRGRALTACTSLALTVEENHYLYRHAPPPRTLFSLRMRPLRIFHRRYVRRVPNLFGLPESPGPSSVVRLDIMRPGRQSPCR